MIYDFEEFKEKIKESERYEFAKRYAVTTNPQDILNKHNKITEMLEDDKYLLELYKIYLRRKGITR